MARFLTHVADSLRALGCQAIILSAKELADAQQNDLLLKILSRFRLPWLLIYWAFVFKVWKSAGHPIIVAISQEYVLPFGFSKQIPIFHDLIQYFFPRNRKSSFYYRYYLPWVSRKLGFAYCVTNATGRMLKRIFGTVAYSICGVPIDREFLSGVGEPPFGELFQSVWVGTLMPHKNHQRVLQTIQSTPHASGNVAMVVPTAEAPALEHEVAMRGLRERIKVFSNLSEDELSSIYRRSKTAMSTSALEGFCMPVLEAALCGCVPVVPNRSTFRENFGLFGVLVPPHDSAYGAYIESAEKKLDRQDVMTRAQVFHETVSERWSASMCEIANAATIGHKDELSRGSTQPLLRSATATTTAGCPERHSSSYSPPDH